MRLLHFANSPSGFARYLAKNRRSNWPQLPSAFHNPLLCEAEGLLPATFPNQFFLNCFPREGASIPNGKCHRWQR